MNDLQDQLRALVDVVPRVTAEEAVARAERRLGPPFVDSGARRGLVRPIVVAASAVVLAGVGVGFAVSASSGPQKIATPPVSPLKQHPKVILTAAQVRAITSHSNAAAASSGTAHVSQTSVQNGVVQDGYNTDVTFSGQNIDEKITFIPEPPGSATSFSTDDRFVDGQFYIYTPGPNDVLEWLHDTNSSNDAASMQFPDPRTLYGAISPEAKFAVEGTTTMNGETVSHLVAGEPTAINTAALGNLVSGTTPTSFELWVDANDIVQQISLSTTSASKECGRTTSFFAQPLTAAEKQQLAPYKRTLAKGKTVYSLSEVPPAVLKKIPGENCATQTTSASVTVTFANLGVPQSIPAPTNAVTYTGKG